MKEQMPLNSKKEQLSKVSLELEKTNRMTENVTDEELKESMVFKMDKLNKKLEVLEKESGLSQKQIMENYQKLSENIVIKNIRDLIHEFDIEEQELILSDISKGSFNSLIDNIKFKNPKMLPMTMGIILIAIVSSISIPQDAIAEKLNKASLNNDVKRIVGGSKTSVKINGNTVFETEEMLEENPLENPLFNGLSSEDQKKVMEILKKRTKFHKKLLNKKNK